MFAKAYATILFFVDDDVVDRLAKAFPRYGLPAFAD
jgi:predicted oxidoreductase (fatty acid repression mutant protein)